MNSSVEILGENGIYMCSLPDLPDYRSSHTQSGLVTCGGDGDINNIADDSIKNYVNVAGVEYSCLTFSSGQWIKSHNLKIYEKYKNSKEDLICLCNCLSLLFRCDSISSIIP